MTTSAPSSSDGSSGSTHNKLNIISSGLEYFESLSDYVSSTNTNISHVFNEITDNCHDAIKRQSRTFFNMNPFDSSNKSQTEIAAVTTGNRFYQGSPHCITPRTLTPPPKNDTGLRKFLSEFIMGSTNKHALINPLYTNGISKTSINQVRSSILVLNVPPDKQPNDIKHTLAELMEKENTNDLEQQSNGEGVGNKLFFDPAPMAPYDNQKKSRSAEAASHLAEGTIRALRDIILDQALELNESLRFWTERRDRPYLSWLEAGPLVWFSEEGYNHELLDEKVSQIQAVLARRCASIGELQEHLLRAGWRRGVAQWGVLGQGDQWDTIVGQDGAIESKYPSSNLLAKNKFEIIPHSSVIGSDNDEQFPADSLYRKVPKRSKDKNVRVKSSHNNTPHSEYYGYTSVFVKNIRGGPILTDDNALACWSVDAIRVVRDQLYRAQGTLIKLPYHENWPQEVKHFDDDDDLTTHDDDNTLPLWATVDASHSNETTDQKDVDSSSSHAGEVEISNFSSMASEVSHLLNTIEEQTAEQRTRRLSKLTPKRKWIRDWYIFAIGVPAIGFVGYKLWTDNLYLDMARLALVKISDFYSEHFSEPVRAIFKQLVTSKGREDITDQKARMHAMETLKKMIKDWLDEIYPQMDEKERGKMALDMDVSLVEKTKENALKHALYEIQGIVHMSMIEMQFIKKELMNAMSAIDELMESNEINFHLGAILPGFMVFYGTSTFFRFLYYSLLKLDKSKEQTYASLRQLILDIERLLIIRDNPPAPPPPLEISRRRMRVGCSSASSNKSSEAADDDIIRSTQEPRGPSESSCVLNSDDLGMLMLLVHECRSILYKHRRRFSPTTIRNITEDFAELTGERGPISVKQQLKIISRMCRTYSFLKVVSAGVSVDQRRFASRFL